MNFGLTSSAALIGVDIVTVEIEATLLQGYTGLQILGLPQEVCRDMRERIRAVLESNKIAVCGKRILVQVRAKENLKLSRSPLTLLDLPIAMAIWQAQMRTNSARKANCVNGENGANGANRAKDRRNSRDDVDARSSSASGAQQQPEQQLTKPFRQRTCFALGEFSLLGEVHLRGQDLFAVAALEKLESNAVVILPQLSSALHFLDYENKARRTVSNFSDILAQKNLFQECLFAPQTAVTSSPPELNNPTLKPLGTTVSPCAQKEECEDYWNKHQLQVQKHLPQVLQSWMHQPRMAVALVLCAATRSHTLISGCPGIGKTHSICLLPNLLPPLTMPEQLDRLLIESGGLGTTADKVFSADILPIRPFRTVHHTCSTAGLIGNHNLRPGELTMAHRGVLFLDELLEFPRSRLECLREPLESKRVELVRAAGSKGLPADFQLVAATNPCRCGHFFSETIPCRCQPTDRKKYWSQLSGPIFDRFAIRIAVSNQSTQRINEAQTRRGPQCSALAAASKMLTEVENSAKARADFIGRFINLQQMHYFNTTGADLPPIPESAKEGTVLNLRALGQEEKLLRAYSYLFLETETTFVVAQRQNLLAELRGLQFAE